MASKRGAENLLKFNASREEKNFALVEHELQLCRKRKLQFKSPGLLAAYISDRTNIHRTTILRNAKYKALIAVYMRSQPGAALIVDDNSDDSWILKAKLAITQAEVGTLRQDIKHLKSQLPKETSESPVKVEYDKSGVDFANLCVLLSLVLSRADTFAVNIQKRTLVDLASRPSESLIGGPERVSAFIAWMDQNASLPFVMGIRKV